jgi:hypothetical protein
MIRQRARCFFRMKKPFDAYFTQGAFVALRKTGATFA